MGKAPAFEIVEAAAGHLMGEEAERLTRDMMMRFERLAVPFDGESLACDDVDQLVELQQELLASAARLVRPGGVVAYVTCSPHLAETAGVIAGRPDSLELIDARPMLPRVPDLGAGPTVQLWPHRHGTDAMFAAYLRRTG